jgi:hypothetical protein
MHRRTITKRTAGGLAVLALAIAAPAAYAASTAASQKPVVHEYIQKSGLAVVSGYDGGAPLQPNR